MRTDIKTPWKSWKIKLRISPQKRKSIKTEMESKSRKETYSTNPEVVKVKKKKKVGISGKDIRETERRKPNSRNSPE